MPVPIATGQARSGAAGAARLLRRSGAPLAPSFAFCTHPRGGLVKQRRLALAGAVLASLAIAGEARAQARVEVDILTCTAGGGTGHIVTSTKPLRCRFLRPGAGGVLAWLDWQIRHRPWQHGKDDHRLGRAGTNREPAAELAQQ